MIRRIIIGTCLVGAAALYLMPVWFMIAGSLKPDDLVLAESGTLRALLPSSINLQNYADVFERVAFGRYLFNSLFITGAIVVCGLMVNSMAGYALARLDWPGRKFTLVAVLALLIIPFEAIAVPLFYQISLLGWRNTYSVQVVPFIANAFAIYLFYSFFAGMPRELEESARIDGAGPLRTFFLLIVPNARPAFASAAILVFLFQWGAFLWPLMVTSGEQVRPLPLAIAQFKSLPPLQWGDILAFSVLMVAPVVVAFFVFQKWFVRSIVATGIKG